MASQRTPGSCCSYRAPEDINDGTRARACAPRPGPVREIDAWWVREYAGRVIYVHEALARAQVGYTGAAILGQLGEDGYDVLREMLWDLSKAASVVVGTTGIEAAVGGGATLLVCGAQAAPGAVSRAAVGLAVGEGLLAWLGLGALVAPLREHFPELGAKFAWAILRAWRSQGNPGALDDAARELGEAVGFFVRLVLQALVGHLFGVAGKEGRGADLAWGQLRDSRLFQRYRGLEGWLVGNLAKLRARLGKTKAETGR
jgi:hypothetical protein